MSYWTPDITPNVTEYAKLDPASRSFYMMLKAQTNPYKIIDEMAKYYVPLMRQQQKIIEEMAPYMPVGFDFDKL